MKTAVHQFRKRRGDDDKVNSCFIFNLVTADLGTLLLVVPLQLVELNVRVWPFSEFFCRFIHSVTNCISYVSVLSIAALSFHRNWVLLKPSWLNCLNSSNAKTFIILIWWSSYTVIGLPLTFVMEVKHSNNGTSECEPNYASTEGKRVHITFMMSLVIIPLLATTCSYYRIRQVFNKFVTSTTGSAYVTTSHASDFLDRLRKFARLVNVIVWGFWICYTPLVVMSLFLAYFGGINFGGGLDRVLVSAGRVMLYFNSVVNPFVLIIVSKPYRKGLICFARLRRQMKQKRTVVSLQVYSKVMPR